MWLTFLMCLEVGVKLIHLIAAFYWIGTTLYLTRNSRNLLTSDDPAVIGEVWGVHGGALWRYTKFHTLPNGVQPTIHFFKYESLTTWASGVLLLLLKYWVGGGDYLSPFLSGTETAIFIAVLTCFGVVSYYIIWMSIQPNTAYEPLGVMITATMFLGIFQVLVAYTSPMVAYYHFALLLVTIMALLNVWGTIIPAQQKMLRAMRDGKPMDQLLADRAMRCTRHNTWLMPGVVLIMISIHYPALFYGGNYLVITMGIVMICGAAVGEFIRRKL